MGQEMLTKILQAAAIRTWLAIWLVLVLCSGAAAQDYPSRTIKLIVPTGAGGITDILARLVGKSVGEQLGQAVIIDNRTGAGGTIGTRAVAHAEPDGYTLLMAFPATRPIRRSMPACPTTAKRIFARFPW